MICFLHFTHDLKMFLPTFIHSFMYFNLIFTRNLYETLIGAKNGYQNTLTIFIFLENIHLTSQ